VTLLILTKKKDFEGGRELKKKIWKIIFEKKKISKKIIGKNIFR
jgi:hypothetical protein